MKADDECMVVRWANEGNLLAVGTKQGQLQLWDMATRRQLSKWRLPDSAIQSIAFSPDSTKIALEGRDRSLSLWDVRTGKMIWSSKDPDGTTVLAEPYARVARVEFTTDGTAILCFGRLWDASNGQQRHTLGKVGPAALQSPYMAQATDAKIDLFEIDTRESVRTYNESGVMQMKFSPDGRYLGVTRAMFGDGATLFAIEGKDHIQLVSGKWCFAIDFSPSTGDIALSAKGEGIQLFNADGETTRNLPTPGVENYSVSFSADGRYLAAVGSNDRIRVWTMTAP